jgi:spore maturation protein CgeB
MTENKFLMSEDHPRILLSGNYAPQTFENCWFHWLHDNGYPVRAFDPTTILRKTIPSNLLWRILWRFSGEMLATAVSQQLLRSARLFRPDLILVVNGNLISSTALKVIRQKTHATLFHYYGEDFFNPLNTKDTLRKSIFYYDYLFTTKTFNIPELAKMGISNISYIPCGYIPNCHCPVTITMEDRIKYGSDLAFVGTFEAERAAILAQLRNFNLRIWGSDWHKVDKESGLRKSVQSRAVYCNEMSRVLNASRVNLAFLRKANRDHHDQRTFEIPACGGFELSERTDEVLSFFEEGEEIECFSSVDELMEKAAYYIEHETLRQRIASAGLARVRRSPYSYTDHIQTILKHYSSMQ